MASRLKNFRIKKQRTNYLGEYLRKQRQKANKSLADVRKDTGLTRGYISMVENGNSSVDDLRKLLFFSNYYDVTLNKLIKLYMEDKQYDW